MPSAQVLTTKLYPPPPRPNLVARARLVERLNAGLNPGNQLVLISASAGFGKTTLASEWIHELDPDWCVTWVSLDSEDNNPTRFLAYLIAALQRIDAGIGENVIPVLQSPHPSPLSELVAQLINQIAATGKKVLLVLDDYHLITAEPVHQAVQLLIERHPNWMHTVILTREDPPFPLPRMRVRGQMTEIRERDLRFTLPEAQAFLVEAMGVELSAEDVEMLKERTEGWAAGLQLAALALEDTADPSARHAFIEAFAGSDRFIVDYLISEVLERQSESARRFLLDTSILERFCAELCDQVVYAEAGSGRSEPVLEDFEQGNMFLVPLDNQRQWFRYHHLFAEMLRHSLRRSAPERLEGLHRRASEWFETQGFTPEAVKHALATGDWDLAAGLLDRHAMRLLFQGQGSLVIDWCSAFPKEVLEQKPALCVYFAWALVLTFRSDYLDEIETLLQAAERAGDAPDLPAGGTMGPLRDWIIGQVCVVRSQVLLARFNSYVDPRELIALSLKGLELLPAAEKPIRAICKINLAHAQTMQNHPAEAQRAFEEAFPYMLEANNYLTAVTCVFYLSRLAYYQGDLERAEASCRQWKSRFASMIGPQESDVPATRGLDIVLSLLLLERGQFEDAERLLVQALELLGWASWMEVHGFLALARLRHLRGDEGGVEETLRRMANRGTQHAGCAEALQTLFEISAAPEDLQARTRAENWAKIHAPREDIPFSLGIGPYHRDVEYAILVIWAQVQVFLGNVNETLAFVEPALRSAKEHGLAYQEIELTLTRALAEQRRGDHAAALADLVQAIQRAEGTGYTWLFISGPASDWVVEELRKKTWPGGSGQRILAAVERVFAAKTSPIMRPATQPPKPAAQAGLVETVSERELEVLRLIAGGYSNVQIAKQLFITEGTVKRHITNLYGKLGVQTRTQAIAKARDVVLID